MVRAATKTVTELRCDSRPKALLCFIIVLSARQFPVLLAGKVLKQRVIPASAATISAP